MKNVKKKKCLLSFLLCSIILISSSFSLPVSACEIPSGDVNLDGKVSSDDARLIMKISLSSVAVPDEIKKIADIDKDNDVSSADARYALLTAIGERKETNSAGTLDAKLTGYTSKGYPVYCINGITYIDNVSIANKTYSLPESYNPADILPECKQAFNEMKAAAAASGLSIYISSGFRSFATQKSIYNRYVSCDGKAIADTYSARPGHSEHQTRLSVDLNTITQAFGKTKEGKWVAENCHKYGFIIRYPEGKSNITCYCYEPWHLRYVGIEAATKIAKSGLCLEEYYGITSSYN